MKRFVALLLCLVLMLPLAACSASDPVQKPKEEKKEDLSQLSAEALYEKALEKTLSLTSASFETRVLRGEEEVDLIETVRIREGYDGVSYSQEGEEKLYINDGTIYVENRLGDFRAKATARSAQEYMTAYWYPISSVPKEALSQLEKEGMTLRFVLEDQKTVALFANAMPQEQGIFVPESVTGVCQVSEEGLFDKQSFTVEGTCNGETIVLVLETLLKECRSAQLQAAIPAAEHVLLGDIRIPHLLEEARLTLEAKEVLQATLLSSETVTAGEEKYSLYREWNYYQPSAETFYLSRQSLKSIMPAKEGTENTSESVFYQILQTDSGRTENEYNVLLGEKLSEHTGEAGATPWKELLEGCLLSLPSLSELSMTEDQNQRSVSFTLQDAGAKVIAARMAAALPECGVDPTSVTGGGTGVFTMDVKTGSLTAFSVLLEGNTAGASVSCQYSVNVDATENVTLPQLQEPTATTPGQGGETAQDHDH